MSSSGGRRTRLLTIRFIRLGKPPAAGLGGALIFGGLLARDHFARLGRPPHRIALGQRMGQKRDRLNRILLAQEPGQVSRGSLRGGSR
jgi:hypothetical protein